MQDEVYTCVDYGYIYNWFTISDARGIVNSDYPGFSVPTTANYSTLIAYLGGATIAGGHMKQTGTTYWISQSSGTDNSSGFNGKGTGVRISTTGAFNGSINYSSSMWTSTINDANNSYAYNLVYNSDNCSAVVLQNNVGASIRLVNNSTSLTHGQTGTYIGSDGKKYLTICIGTQEWLTEPLSETMYDNGDTIPLVTSNTTWAATSIGARCAYDNDANNVLCE